MNDSDVMIRWRSKVQDVRKMSVLFPSFWVLSNDGTLWDHIFSKRQTA